ncbi:MAG: beta-mannosidase [Fibrobacter sp.]|nr:beta-mannosidase [Fibrobacter sp.]
MNLKTLLAFGLATAAASQAAISYAPVNPNATDAAKKLYNFLATNFGNHTISGVQTGDVDSDKVKSMFDVQAVYDAAGKYPALVGFDFLFANGIKASDSWYQSYTQTAIDAAADLWANGGIPAFSWHWKDPSHTIDAFYTKAGNPKEFTNFDYTKGFKAGTTEWDETSETYKQIVEDIDEIAVYFKQLQEKGVAAIFRPLHESGGAFFWWSAVTNASDMHKGAEYAALYRLVYDRMVKVNGVNNLIWVWNAQTDIFDDATWNPGAEYYDVFSVDIYNPAYDYQSNSAAFKKMQQINGDKILALSENGPIPDASLMYKDGAVWSWNMPWYESWDGKYVSKTKNTVWEANLKSPCVYALEDMPGWDNYTISNAPAAACEVGYALADLDTAVDHTITFPADTATNGYLMVTANASAADTAKGNIVIKSGKIDLSTAKVVTLEVDNSNNDAGVWFTIAFLTGAPDWAWAQPDGCWINGGEVTTCEIDLSTTAKDQEILEGDDYTNFMKNISKFYIEFFGAAWSGTLFFDDVKTDAGVVINDFNKVAKITVEEGSFVKAQIIGTGNSAAIPQVATNASAKLSVSGNSIMFNAAKPGMTSVEVFGMNGKRVATLFRGMLTAGTHAFDMSELSKGQYIIRVKGAGFTATQPIRR